MAIIIDQEMTIYHAADIWKMIIESIRQVNSGAVKMDLSAVGEMDTAGAQLLLMTKKVCEENSYKFSIDDASDQVLSSLILLGLEDLVSDR
ncbi:MAG: STAS domain-containing protein [Gammaproteobacteria bacterium]|nr:STAS domain-containing protein [Gammaproteobacteria bacterium]